MLYARSVSSRLVISGKGSDMQAIGVYLLQWFLSASLAFCVPNGDSLKVTFAGRPRIKVRVTDDFLLVWGKSSKSVQFPLLLHKGGYVTDSGPAVMTSYADMQLIFKAWSKQDDVPFQFHVHMGTEQEDVSLHSLIALLSNINAAADPKRQYEVYVHVYSCSPPPKGWPIPWMNCLAVGLHRWQGQFLLYPPRHCK